MEVPPGPQQYTVPVHFVSGFTPGKAGVTPNRVATQGSRGLTCLVLVGFRFLLGSPGELREEGKEIFLMAPSKMNTESEEGEVSTHVGLRDGKGGHG